MKKLKKRTSASSLRYFYMQDNLYRVLRIVRAEDSVECWNYTLGKTQLLQWSFVRKHSQRAFPLTEVCKMLGRTRVTLENAMLDGKIPTPQRIYALDLNRRPGKYMFSEADVFAVHEYLLTVHIGRPRNDGKITPGKMPSRAELRALMRHDTVMYVKNDDGEFVPAWKEIEW